MPKTPGGRCFRLRPGFGATQPSPPRVTERWISDSGGEDDEDEDDSLAAPQQSSDPGDPGDPGVPFPGV